MINISVIIPCYNAANTIKECLDSVINQTQKVDEIIIVDDGSIDNSVQLIEKYIESSSERITLIKQQNFGPSKARNNGVKKAKNDWIAFLDADDKWVSNKIEIQTKFFIQNPEIALIGGGHEKRFFKKEITSVPIDIKKLCLKNFFETPTVMINKKAFSEFYFDEKMKYAEDYDLWLNVINKYKALYVNNVLSYSILQKRSFGEIGLSSQIFKMEKGELDAITNQLRLGHINFPFYLFATTVSIIKFIRRFLITNYHRIISK